MVSKFHEVSRIRGSIAMNFGEVTNDLNPLKTARLVLSLFKGMNTG
jgi:hypothetical protein